MASDSGRCAVAAILRLVKVYEQLAQAFLDLDYGTMFGVMGGANMHMVATYRERGGEYVAATHEGAAVSMAQAFGRRSGKPGLVTVTCGPGFTNALTGIVVASRQRSPLLVVTGEPTDPSHGQRLAIASLCEAAEISALVAREDGSISDTLTMALRTAVSDQRAAVLVVPDAVMQGDATAVLSVLEAKAAAPVVPPQEALERAAAVLTASHRPIILAGLGASDDETAAQVVRLAELSGANLATTAVAMDLFKGHPRNLGIFGGPSRPATARAIAASDCVLALGASLNRYTTFRGSLVDGKRLIQVDHELRQLGATVTPEVQVLGDARLTTEALVEMLSEMGTTPASGWSTASGPADDDSGTGDDGPQAQVWARRVMELLNDVLPHDKVVVSDTGRWVPAVWPFIEVASPAHFVPLVGFIAIGVGLAGAVGAAVHDRSSVTVGLAGDGSFMMNAAELATAVREKLRLVMVILNDGAYGAEYQKLLDEGLDPSHSLMEWPDLAELARGMGAQAVTVACDTDLAVLRTALEDIQGPLVIDVRLNVQQRVVW